MNIQDYTKAARTFDAHRPESMLDALAHGLVAEATEALEACFGRDTGAFFDELGDVQWELARIADYLHISTVVLEEAECERCPANVPIVSSLAIALAVEAGRFSGLMEKRHRTNKVVTDDQLASRLYLVWQRLTWLAWLCGWTMDQVRAGNIEKLSARYAAA